MNRRPKVWTLRLDASTESFNGVERAGDVQTAYTGKERPIMTVVTMVWVQEHVHEVRNANQSRALVSRFQSSLR